MAQYCIIEHDIPSQRVKQVQLWNPNQFITQLEFLLPNRRNQNFSVHNDHCRHFHKVVSTSLFSSRRLGTKISENYNHKLLVITFLWETFSNMYLSKRFLSFIKMCFLSLRVFCLFESCYLSHHDESESESERKWLKEKVKVKWSKKSKVKESPQSPSFRAASRLFMKAETSHHIYIPKGIIIIINISIIIIIIILNIRNSYLECI